MKGSVIQSEVVLGCKFQVRWTSSDRDKVSRRPGSIKSMERKCGKCKQSHAKVVRA